MKKVLVLVLVLALSFSLFAQGVKEAPKASGERVKITMLMKDVDPIVDADLTHAVEEYIEKGLEKQGKLVDVEFISAPTGSYATVTPIAYRTGQINPDLIYFQGNDQPVALEGLLEDLTPYVEGSTNVKNAMESHNWAQLKNYPYILWLEPNRVKVPVIKASLAARPSAQAVLADPSLDNYYAMLKDLVESGAVKFAITTDGSITELDSVFNHAFGVASTLVKNEKGDWVFTCTTEAEKNKLAFYAKLYKEGLLNNSYVTSNWEIKEKNFYEGDVAIIMGTSGDTVNVYANKVLQTSGEELIVLPPAGGVSYTSTDVTKPGRGFGINSSCENKDMAWAVLEYVASPEGRIIDKLGVEGIHYNVENGKYVLTDQFASWWPRVWPTQNNLDKSKVVGEIYTSTATSSLEMIREYYHDDTNVLLSEEMLPYKDALNSLYKEYATDIIRGTRPVSDFDEFVAKWNASGAAEMTAYLNSVLN